MITLSYNPKEVDVPTVTQRLDNVLCLEKYGGKQDCEYVLFPYVNEEEYKDHRFFKSIEKVNIDGLPFLPSAITMVTDILDELIANSPDTAFERTTLPVGIEERLAKTNWDDRNVYVAAVGSKEKLDAVLESNRYHVDHVSDAHRKMNPKFIALYQPKDEFGVNSGIYRYAEILATYPLKKDSSDTDLGCDHVIREWKTLNCPIKPKERRCPEFTTKFLLEHSTEVPELFIKNEQQYRLYAEVKRRISSATINEEDTDQGFVVNGSRIAFADGEIQLYKKDGGVVPFLVSELIKRPTRLMKKIEEEIG